MTHDELLWAINSVVESSPCETVGHYSSAKALRAIVELHNPNHPFSIPSDLKCAGCDGLDQVDYPCQTIQAIEAELG
jgi:hypothetical protein